MFWRDSTLHLTWDLCLIENLAGHFGKWNIHEQNALYHLFLVIHNGYHGIFFYKKKSSICRLGNTLGVRQFWGVFLFFFFLNCDNRSFAKKIQNFPHFCFPKKMKKNLSQKNHFVLLLAITNVIELLNL